MRGILVSLVLVLSGLSIFGYRSTVLEIPIVLDTAPDKWIVEATVRVEPGNKKRGKIELSLPPGSPYHTILSDKIFRGELGVAKFKEKGREKIIWSGTVPGEGEKLRYQLTVSDVQDSQRVLTKDKWKKESAELSASKLEKIGNFVKKHVEQPIATKKAIEKIAYDLMYSMSEEAKKVRGSSQLSNRKLSYYLHTILVQSAIPARILRGVLLGRTDKTQKLLTWLEIDIEGKPRYFVPNQQRWIKPDNRLIWSVGPGYPLSANGFTNLRLSFSASPFYSNRVSRGIVKASNTEFFSLAQLPVELQSAFRGLLLIPLGALVLVLLRSLIGIRTFGTFMPVLLALSFRETGFLAGLSLFLGVVSVGMIARAILTQLDLLLVPRLSFVLIVVLGCLVVAGHFSFTMGLDVESSISLLPIVILTMMIERMILLWEELGALTALGRLANTVVGAGLAFVVMSSEMLEYLMFMFPELLLVVLGIVVMLGRYTGYRLVEIYRFRSLGVEEG